MRGIGDHQIPPRLTQQRDMSNGRSAGQIRGGSNGLRAHFTRATKSTWGLAVGVDQPLVPISSTGVSAPQPSRRRVPIGDRKPEVTYPGRARTIEDRRLSPLRSSGWPRPILPACRGSRMGSADDIPRSLHRQPRSDRSPIVEGHLAQDCPQLHRVDIALSVLAWRVTAVAKFLLVAIERNLRPASFAS